MMANSSRYRDLADYLNGVKTATDLDTIDKRSIEEECIDEHCTVDAHCQMTTDNCNRCIGFGGFKLQPVHRFWEF